MTSTPLWAPSDTLAAALPGAGKRAGPSRAKRGSPRKAAAGSDAGQNQAAAAGAIELAAAIVAVSGDEPLVEVLAESSGQTSDRLPSALFQLDAGPHLEDSLRVPIENMTGHVLGYMQQLFAFVQPAGARSHILVGYLALVHDERRSGRVRGQSARRSRASRWHGCYEYLPWEDWRAGRPALVDRVLIPQLTAWVRSGQPSLSKAALARLQSERATRARLAFGSPSLPWEEDKVLSRFDLLVEAGIIAEERQSGVRVPATKSKRTDTAEERASNPAFGRVMFPGHRRILAGAIGRLRADLKTRPIVFELMDEEFSLYELQQTVEAILGPNLHKQNFRRLIETAGLVEPTGRMKSHTGGRPAKLFRFRRDVMLERPAPGLKIRN